MDHVKDVSLYLPWWQEKCWEYDALYGQQVLNLQASVDDSNVRSMRKVQRNDTVSVELSQDMRMIAAENEEETIWTKNGWKLGEGKLKERLDRAFEVDDIIHAKVEHCVLELYFRKINDGGNFVGYATYNDWRKGKRKSPNPLDKGSVIAMDGFVKLHESGKLDVLKEFNNAGIEMAKKNKNARKARGWK